MSPLTVSESSPHDECATSMVEAMRYVHLCATDIAKWIEVNVDTVELDTLRHTELLAYEKKTNRMKRKRKKKPKKHKPKKQPKQPKLTNIGGGITGGIHSSNKIKVNRTGGLLELPAGWSKQIKIRGSGATSGQRDTYFIDPNGK